MALDPEHGPELFAADVTAFIGHDAAFRRLKALSISRAETTQAARLLAVAAGVALSAGRMQDAFETSARALELDPARITEDTHFREDLSADSLDLYTLVQELEDSYGVKMSDEEAARITTVGQAVDFVVDRAPANS